MEASPTFARLLTPSHTLLTPFLAFSQVRPFIDQFRVLDVNGDARLGPDDLHLMVGKTRKEVAAMSAALPQVELSVGDRMGLAMAGRGTPSPTQRSASPTSVGGAAAVSVGAGYAYSLQTDINLGSLAVEELDALVGRAQAVAERKREQATLLGRAQAVGVMADEAALPAALQRARSASRSALGRTQISPIKVTPTPTAAPAAGLGLSPSLPKPGTPQEEAAPSYM